MKFIFVMLFVLVAGLGLLEVGQQTGIQLISQTAFGAVAVAFIGVMTDVVASAARRTLA